MGDTYTNILFHIIFSTKHRRPFITPEIQPRLYEYLGGIIRAHRGVLYQIGGMADHLHLLVSWNTGAISDLMRELKSDSTKWVKQTFADQREYQWQSGGAIFSVSQSQLERMTHYIQTQETHHRRLTFEEEYLGFLKKNAVSYDERNVFE